MADAYDALHEARLAALDQFGVTGKPLHPRYRCTRGDTTLVPSVPLTGDIVQHVCLRCGRSVDQPWSDYHRQDNMLIDIRCPSVHQHPEGHLHEAHPLYMVGVEKTDG